MDIRLSFRADSDALSSTLQREDVSVRLYDASFSRIDVLRKRSTKFAVLSSGPGTQRKPETPYDARHGDEFLKEDTFRPA